MQIQSAKYEELGLIIFGLRSIYIADLESIRRRLLEQMENELSTRYGLKLKEEA